MADPRVHDEPTTTKAYKANYVPQVWMSFNRNDLLAPSNKKTGDSFDLTQILKSFEFNFDQQSGSMGYKIKLINPTAEFEQRLMSHYSKLYPLEAETFNNIVKNEERTSGLETSDFNTSAAPTMPQLFIRWGYGPKTTDGVSRIHKAMLTQASFKLAANKDKEVELELVDPFSYSKDNPKFTNKDHAVTIPIIQDDKFIRPSEVVSEILAYYTSVFPGTFVWANLKGGFPSYMDSIDVAFTRMVMALNKPGEDAVAEARKTVAGGTAAEAATGAIKFSQAELDALNESLTSKLPTELEALADHKSKETGKINPNIIAQAYKYLLDALGINFKLGIALSDSESAFLMGKDQTGTSDAAPNMVEEDMEFSIDEGQKAGESLADFKDKDVINPFEVEVWDGNNKVTMTMEEGGFMSGEDFSCNDLEDILAGRQGTGNKEGNPDVEVKGSLWDFELTTEGVQTVKAVLAATQRQHSESTDTVSAEVLPGGTRVDLPDAPEDETSVGSDGGVISTSISMGAQQYYATLGTIGTTPIDRVLKNIINAVNQFVVGSAQDPLRVQNIPISLLNDIELKDLAEAMGFSNQAADSDFGTEEKATKVNANVALLKKYEQVVAIASEKVMRNDIVKKFLTSRIYSFPEIVSDGEGHNGLVWMRYGFTDSIVGKLDFKSDNRAMFDLMNSNYIVRQQNDYREFFGGDKDEAGNKLQGMINYMIKSSNVEDISGAGAVNIVNKPSTGTEKDSQETSMEITGDTVEFLEKMSAAYTQDQEAFDELFASENHDFTKKDFRMFFSVMRDANMKNMIFPTADIDGQINSQRAAIAHTMENGKLKVKQKETFVFKKRINLSIVEQLAGGGGENRAMDQAASYLLSVGRQAWQLKMTTLGVPEMDMPVSEMMHRRILLTVREPRSPQSDHWLSGPYMIRGLKHKLDPNKGYLTEFNLIKDAALMSKFGKMYQHKDN